MNTNIYLFFDGVTGVIGPHKSPWMSSRALFARKVVACGNGSLACFPSKHDEQVSFSISILGIHVTSSLLIITRIDSLPMCPNLACHFAESLVAVSCKHLSLTMSIRTLYSRFFYLFAFTISLSSLSLSVRRSSFFLTSQPDSVACPKLIMLLFKSGIY